jgi:hypothetical protein
MTGSNDGVKSLSEFIDVLFAKIENLGEHNIVWFRGENSNKYDLVPNIYRKARNNKIVYCQDILNTNHFNILEQNIDTSFYRKSFRFFSAHGIENSIWNRYFLKQHYGIKTRLLDWTENALFALYFSIYYNTMESDDSRVWMLSPFTLNNYSVSKLHATQKTFYKILTLSDFESKQDLINEEGELRTIELGRKYYRIDCKKDERLYPLAIYPPHLDQRMAAQQSCFTLFGNVVRGLNNNDSTETFLEFIDINANSRQKILKELKLIGISTYSVFPDLDGLGKAINEDSAYDIDKSQNNSDIDAFFNEVG